MPNFRTHCAISKKRTGIDFAELHRWIDKPTKDLGADHRKIRHSYNEKDKKTIKKYWETQGEGLGEKAVIEWLFHIAIDNLTTAFKMSSKSFSYGQKTYNLMHFGLNKSGFVHCDFERDQLNLIKKGKGSFDSCFRFLLLCRNNGSSNEKNSFSVNDSNGMTRIMV